MIGDAGKINVLATVKQDGKDHPQVWTKENGKGRVFVSVLGHYTWTHEDPLFQELILRGIAWASGKDELRFAEENFRRQMSNPTVCAGISFDLIALPAR